VVGLGVFAGSGDSVAQSLAEIEAGLSRDALDVATMLAIPKGAVVRDGGEAGNVR
jgi:hypothetical protein